MSLWPRTALADVLDFREGPGILAVDFHDSGVPLVRLAGLKQNGGLLKGCNFLDPVKVENRWKQFRLELGDVLLSTSASLGEVAIVGNEGVGAIPYTGLISFRPKDDRVHAMFIPLMLREKAFKDQIEAMGVGSVMKHFGPTHLRKMSVSLPPIEEQRAIAEVLGALDDKIAANTRLAATADELATTTFRSLLGVHPVRLSDQAQFVNGRAFTKGASGEGRMVVRIAELNGGPSGSTVYSDAEVDEKHTARSGDILFAWSGSLTLQRWFRAESIVNQHIFKVIPNAGIPQWLIYQLLSLKMAEFKSIAADKATTMGHIQRRHLDTEVLLPDPVEVDRVTLLMEGLWAAALNAQNESLTLAETRDALLPKLMSGQLRVRDAERIASNAGA